MNIDLTFDSRGQGIGKYEAFIELAENDTITIHPPEGWTIAGAALYPGVNGNASAKSSLRGQNPNWSGTFQDNPGFDASTMSWSVQNGTGVITDHLNADNTAAYEFLVWIQSTNAGGQTVNDFLDPGIRNR